MLNMFENHLDLAQRLCSELANCRPLVMIEGGGHAFNLTHPTFMNPIVQRYLVELDLAAPRGAERRGGGRRSSLTRRVGERRDPVRASVGRRVLHPVDRRIGERRGHERRQSWRANSPTNVGLKSHNGATL